MTERNETETDESQTVVCCCQLGSFQPESLVLGNAISYDTCSSFKRVTTSVFFDAGEGAAALQTGSIASGRVGDTSQPSAGQGETFDTFDRTEWVLTL